MSPGHLGWTASCLCVAVGVPDLGKGFQVVPDNETLFGQADTKPLTGMQHLVVGAELGLRLVLLAFEKLNLPGAHSGAASCSPTCPAHGLRLEVLALVGHDLALADLMRKLRLNQLQSLTEGLPQVLLTSCVN